MTQTPRAALIRRLERQQKVALIFVGALVRRQRGFVDRLLVALFRRMTARTIAREDFRRDPLIEAEPEFTVEELARFRAGGAETGSNGEARPR